MLETLKTSSLSVPVVEPLGTDITEGAEISEKLTVDVDKKFLNEKGINELTILVQNLGAVLKSPPASVVYMDRSNNHPPLTKQYIPPQPGSWCLPDSIDRSVFH